MTDTSSTPEDVRAEIDHLKRLLLRVKSGEWSLMECWRAGDRSVMSEIEVRNEDCDVLVATEVRRAPSDGGRDAMDLIVHSHNALPGLFSHIDQLHELLTEIRDNGLIYWEPNTPRGHERKADMLARIDTMLGDSK